MTDKPEKPYRYSPLVTSKTKQVTVRVPLELISKMELLSTKRSVFINECIEIGLAYNVAKTTKPLPFKVQKGTLGLVQIAAYGIVKELDRQGLNNDEIADTLNRYQLRNHLLENWDGISLKQFRGLYLS